MSAPAELLTTEVYDLLDRVLAVVNGKGGVLKTSVVANLGGVLARNSWRVLVIDLDKSGNLKLDLGLAGTPADDQGRSIFNAVWDGEPLKVNKNVRPSLDFICGGKWVGRLAQLAKSDAVNELPAGSIGGEFALRLSEIADEYDLILIDCPPNDMETQAMALAAARRVLIPTRSDVGSWEGLKEIGPLIRKAREKNPSLSYLGMVLTGHTLSATRIEAAARKELSQLRDTIPLFETTIRYSETAAYDCRIRGQLAHELARDAEASQAERLVALRTRRRRTRVVSADAAGEQAEAAAVAAPSEVPAEAESVVPAALSGSAGALASDYKKLAAEVTRRLEEAEARDAEQDSSAGDPASQVVVHLPDVAQAPVAVVGGNA